MFAKRRIPTLIGLFLITLGVAAGVLLVTRQQFFGVEAESIRPQDVRVTNVTDGSFAVSWTTTKGTSGFVKYGTTVSSVGEIAGSSTEEAGIIHHVTVPGAGANGLEPDTAYYFKIVSDSVEFDNSGVVWSVGSTGPKLSLPAGEPSVISGKVIDESGNSVKGALVRASLAGADNLSTLTSSSGDWSLTLSTARSTDRQNYASITGSSVIDIFVRGPSGKIASAKLTPSVAKPAPPITIGQSHDFRSTLVGEVNPSNDLPAASVPTGVPELSGEGEEDATSPGGDADSGGSRFSVVDSELVSPSVDAVVVESHENGEVIGATKPEFFGEAPAGITLTIKIESSSPQTDQVEVLSNGDWSWSPPENLEPGEHKLTVSWRDSVTGVLRSVTRTFIVQASDDPAFVSTPSATASTSPSVSPTSTPATTSSPKPTSTATSTPTSSASATPRVSIPSTESGVPVAGDLTPTLMLLMMGLGLVLFGYISVKKSVKTK